MDAMRQLGFPRSMGLKRWFPRSYAAGELMSVHCEAFLVPTQWYYRRSITKRARSSDSVTRYPLFGDSFWSRLDVEVRHAPERIHDE